MENFLNSLRKRFKSNKAEIVILALIVLFGILSFLALASDIGFSEEIKQHRYKLLYASVAITIVYAIGSLFISTVRENNSLALEVSALRNDQESKKREIKRLTELQEEREEEIAHQQQTILRLVQEITAKRVLEVVKVQFFNEKVYLTLSKKKDIEISIGSEIRVIDKAEGYVMGVFDVTRVNDKECVAINSAYINPLWLGFIRQPGNAETSGPPDSLAIF